MKFFYLFVPTNMNCLQQTIDMPLEMKMRFLEYLDDCRDVVNLSIALGKDFYNIVRQGNDYIWNIVYQNLKINMSFKYDTMNHFQFLNLMNTQFPKESTSYDFFDITIYRISIGTRRISIRFSCTNFHSHISIKVKDPNTVFPDMIRHCKKHDLILSNRENLGSYSGTFTIRNLLIMILNIDDFLEPDCSDNFLRQLKQVL